MILNDICIVAFIENDQTAPVHFPSPSFLHSHTIPHRSNINMINIKTGDMLSVAITQIEGYMPMDSSLSITLFL